jgi:hypothetical protein
MRSMKKSRIKRDKVSRKRTYRKSKKSRKKFYHKLRVNKKTKKTKRTKRTKRNKKNKKMNIIKGGADKHSKVTRGINTLLMWSPFGADYTTVGGTFPATHWEKLSALVSEFPNGCFLRDFNMGYTNDSEKAVILINAQGSTVENGLYWTEIPGTTQVKFIPAGSMQKAMKYESGSTFSSLHRIVLETNYGKFTFQGKNKDISEFDEKLKKILPETEAVTGGLSGSADPADSP